MGGEGEEVGIDGVYRFCFGMGYFSVFVCLFSLCYISVQKMFQFLKNKQISFVFMEHLKILSSVAVTRIIGQHVLI